MLDAETTIRKVINKIIDQLQYKNADISLKVLTSGGANYTSALYSITVTATDRDDLKLFGKVANISEMLREVMKIDIMFKTEQFTYSRLVEVYDNIQDRHKLSPEQRFQFPKFYGGDSAVGEETVIMEDLTAKGYGTYSRFKSMDWEYAATAVEHLAKFHALSFAYKKEDPENFAKDAEVVKYIKPEHSEDSPMAETWNKMIAGAVQVVKEEHKGKLMKLFEDDATRDAFHKFKAPLSTPVLCHGDYRVSNLLFRRLDGRLDPIVVDYQTVHKGCPVTDLLYLEFLGTDKEFRRENHQRLLDHYFRELASALDRLGVDINEVYPRETFDTEIKEMFPPALCFAMVVLPLVLVEEEQAPHMSGMTEVKDFALSPSERFAERYRDLVSDCVEWGVI